MNIYIFEDLDAINLSPISYTRPAFEIHCGLFTCLERIKFFFPEAELSFFVRNELIDVVKNKYPSNSVNPSLVNEGVWLLGNVLWSKDDLDFVIYHRFETYVNGEKIIGIKLKKEEGQKWVDNGGPLKKKLKYSSKINNELSSPVINYLWDAVNNNPNQIALDSKFVTIAKDFRPSSIITLIEAKKIFIDNNSLISPYTFFDASKGEIIVEKNVKISPFCYLEGPLFIGKGSTIRPNTQIRGGTSIGPFSKIGGEISQSIFQGNTNKIHYGYIGNSYIGEWVNIGAGTTCSNLKNNYSSIKVQVNGSLIDTKKNKIGCYIGDYTKIAIGTYLNTGTVIGAVCNIAPKGIPIPKYLQPFTWFANNEKIKYEWEKFVKTLEIYKKGKGLSITDVELSMLKEKYDTIITT